MILAGHGATRGRNGTRLTVRLRPPPAGHDTRRDLPRMVRDRQRAGHRRCRAASFSVASILARPWRQEEARMQVQTTIPHADWRAIPRVAKAAEETGFDGLTTSEIANDLFIPLAFAALATERIQLATAIAVAFARSPMVVANLAWDLQLNSRGRLCLGLGTQVKGHNERRFSVPWGPPVPRLREYVESLRAIWRCWELGEPLRYEGQHYRFSLMTPEFSPPPSGLPPVPVTIAAVGPDMMRLAGRACDGVRLHGFCTRRYLEEVALPQIQEGLARSGRSRASFQI